MGFDRNIRQVEQRASEASLAILVWGPGRDDAALYVKREKIKDRLATEFPNVEIRFSEDQELDKMIQGSAHLSVPEKEIYHLAACDVCVVLDASKGAGEEIALFSLSRLSEKFFILTHEQYRDVDSFPAQLRKYHNQVFYTDEEFVSCNMVERVVTHVRIEATRRLFFAPAKSNPA